MARARAIKASISGEGSRLSKMPSALAASPASSHASPVSRRARSSAGSSRNARCNSAIAAGSALLRQQSFAQRHRNDGDAGIEARLFRGPHSALRRCRPPPATPSRASGAPTTRPCPPPGARAIARPPRAASPRAIRSSASAMGSVSENDRGHCSTPPCRDVPSLRRGKRSSRHPPRSRLTASRRERPAWKTAHRTA